MRSFSMLSLRLWIWDLSWEPSFVVTLAAITGLETPHAAVHANGKRAAALFAQGGAVFS